MKLALRKMQRKDLEFVNNIRNHNTTRSMLENNNIISYSDTLSWFLNSSPDWLIIEDKKEKVGYIRTSDDTGNSICIGCDIHPEKRRMGYAFYAYKLVIENLYTKKYSVLWLKVFEKNIPAVNLYEKLGFKTSGSEISRGEKYLTMIHIKV